MAATMLVDPNLLDTDRFDAVSSWDGAIITSLAELVNVLKEQFVLTGAHLGYRETNVYRFFIEN